MQKRIALFSVVALLLCSAAFAQMGGGGARPSPAASATCDLGAGKTIKTDYSSPRVKGRKIYGDLVSYGKVWRLGANEATTLVTTATGKFFSNGLDLDWLSQHGDELRGYIIDVHSLVATAYGGGKATRAEFSGV